jgi:hypothetical protein
MAGTTTAAGHIALHASQITLVFFHFGRAFAKLRKAMVTVVISVRPSVRLSAWVNSAPIGRIFIKMLYFGIFRKSVQKSQVSLIFDANRRHFTRTATPRSFLFE